MSLEKKTEFQVSYTELLFQLGSFSSMPSFYTGAAWLQNERRAVNLFSNGCFESGMGVHLRTLVEEYCAIVIFYLN